MHSIDRMSGLLTTRSAEAGKWINDRGNMMTTIISVLSRQGCRWHDNGAPKGGRIPAWMMVGWGKEP
jgi:hypothetical protein